MIGQVTTSLPRPTSYTTRLVLLRISSTSRLRSSRASSGDLPPARASSVCISGAECLALPELVSTALDSSESEVDESLACRRGVLVSALASGPCPSSDAGDSWNCLRSARRSSTEIRPFSSPFTFPRVVYADVRGKGTPLLLRAVGEGRGEPLLRLREAASSSAKLDGERAMEVPDDR